MPDFEGDNGNQDRQGIRGVVESVTNQRDTAGDETADNFCHGEEHVNRKRQEQQMHGFFADLAMVVMTQTMVVLVFVVMFVFVNMVYF